jgi:hypothetical protein
MWSVGHFNTFKSETLYGQNLDVLGGHMYRNTTPQNGIHNHFDHWNQRDMKYMFEINLKGINYSKSQA